MTRIALAVLFFTSLGVACTAVPGDKILVRDFGRSRPEFAAAADQEKVVSFAPLPGTQRNFTAREVRALAQRVGIQVDGDMVKDVCFIRDVHDLTAQDFQSALVAATKGAASGIDVLDFNRAAVPEGRLEFQLSQVSLPPASAPETPVLWRGRFVPSSGRSFPTWVKARIVAETQLVFAKETLLKGRIIAPGQVELRAARQFPFVSGHLPTLDEIIGKIARHDIVAGHPVPSNAVEERREVESGDTVRVESASGLAQIHFDARAQTAGRNGDTILIQNPGNGRRFRALVTGKGQVEAKPLESMAGQR